MFTILLEIDYYFFHKQNLLGSQTSKGSHLNLRVTPLNPNIIMNRRFIKLCSFIDIIISTKFLKLLVNLNFQRHKNFSSTEMMNKQPIQRLRDCGIQKVVGIVNDLVAIRCTHSTYLFSSL